MLLGGSFRPRCVCAQRRAPGSAFCDGERVVFTDVCRRASRPATRCGLDENEYYAALYGFMLPACARRLRRLALVGLRLRLG